MSSETQTEPGSSSGPSWMGCLFPAIAAVVFLSLGMCTAVTGWKQNRVIAGFTEPEARSFGRGVPSLHDSQGKALKAKISEVQRAAREQSRVEVEFTAGELNHLIQTQPLLDSLKDTTRVRRIGAGGVEVESSQPVRKLGGGVRYLNGVYVFRPAASQTNAWQMELLSLEVPGKEVPQGFLKLMRDLKLFRFDLNAKELQEVLRRVERMDLAEGKVVVVTRGAAAGEE